MVAKCTLIVTACSPAVSIHDPFAHAFVKLPKFNCYSGAVIHDDLFTVSFEPTALQFICASRTGAPWLQNATK